jgi:hypothetical protein
MACQCTRGGSDSKRAKLHHSPQKSLFTSERVIAPSGLHLTEQSLRTKVTKKKRLVRRTACTINDKKSEMNYLKGKRITRGK